VQDDVLHDHLNLGQLDHLVGIVGCRGGELRLPTSAGRGPDFDDLCGRQQRLLMAAVPWLGAGFALGASAGWPLLIRRIGRGGRSESRERCCTRASSSAMRASSVWIRASNCWMVACCCWITSTSCRTTWHTTKGVCAQLAASSRSPAGGGREETMVSLSRTSIDFSGLAPGKPLHAGHARARYAIPIPPPGGPWRPGGR
jgi:hypothetical protein